MNPNIKTQDVARNLYVNYLRKSDECFRAANDCFLKGDWNARPGLTFLGFSPYRK